MITRLSISNYALIDELTITFGDGLSVITGETGAGKSIILGALSLLLGGKPDNKAVRMTDTRTVIEGEFNIEAYHLQSFFEENELDYDSHCILRREFNPSGRSRDFINDSPVSVAQLQQLSERLIDIHSQHQNLLIGDSLFQLRIIDTLAGNQALTDEYQTHFRRHAALRREVKELEQRNTTAHNDEEYLRFQLTQLTEAKLTPGEEDELTREQTTLSHAEEIKSDLVAINTLLNDDEASILSLIRIVRLKAASLSRLYPETDELTARIESNYIDLKDIADELSRHQESVEVNPERLEQVESRLNTLFGLRQKHRVNTIDELIEIETSLTHQLNDIEHNDEAIAQLYKEITNEKEILRNLGKQLTASRQQAGEAFAPRMEAMARPLGMPAINFAVRITPKATADIHGDDDVTFVFSANKNREPQPIALVASGGEISRLMLCLKSLIAGEMSLPSIIFDEIDTGVSGEVADKMGEIMQQMGAYMQVITITHLPQVAARGKRHYKVYKQHDEDASFTRIAMLNEEERINELAQMLSGQALTQAAYDNARELLKQNRY